MVASRGLALLLLVLTVLAASVVAQQSASCPDYTWRTVHFSPAIVGCIGVPAAVIGDL